MFPSLNQLFKKIRCGKTRFLKSPALDGAPFKRGIVYKVAQMSPRKPNSARRTFAKVRIISNNKRIFAKIPGIGDNNLQPHNLVIVRGHGPKDSPGINYHLIRGLGDFIKVESVVRSNRRSKFGVKKVKL